MTPLDIARHRLYHQQIAVQQFKNPAQVVDWLGAVQAQDYSGAKWSIGLRLPDATDADITKAIAGRTIIRTWPMRGTLHFVAAADIRWMVTYLTPRIIAGSAVRAKRLELDDTTFARCRKLFTRALQGGRQLARDAMYAVLEDAGVSAEGYRGLHILCRLSQEGLLCFAAPEDKQQTFALLEEWVPAVKKIDRDEALAGFAKRYFTSHGPATLNDFTGWCGLKVSDAKAAIDAVASQLAWEKIDGKTFWMSRDAPVLRKTTPTAWLLPGFDEYMLGYKDRSAALDPLHAEKICPGSNGMFSPTIIIDGRVAGTWKRTVKKVAVHVAPVPFAPLSPAQIRAIEVPAKRYGDFLGLPVTVARGSD
jgi:hypothetical protein